MTQDSSTARPAGRGRFLLLLALFAAPVLGAYLIYFYWPGAAPTATTNYGSLFAPIRALPEDAALVDSAGAGQGTEVPTAAALDKALQRLDRLQNAVPLDDAAREEKRRQSSRINAALDSLLA